MRISVSTRFLCAAGAGVALACAFAIAPQAARSSASVRSTRPALPAGGSKASAARKTSDRGSWMDPDAKAHNLLYVSSDSGSDDQVYVYTYPERRLVGTLSGIRTPEGICVDQAGDVYIVSTVATEILEFAHAGTSPIAVLSDPEGYPQGCAIDPTTGNLAVTDIGGNPSSSQGNVAIYAGASGTPTYYTDPYMYRPYFCAYDDKGNLFLDGLAVSTGTFQFSEMKQGRSTFININLNQTIYTPGGVQWDGKHIAVGDQGNGYGSTVYRTNGARGKVVATVPLNGSCEVAGFWIEDHTLIGPTNDCNQSVAFWKYPTGGNATKTISGVPNSVFAVAVSLAGSP